MQSSQRKICRVGTRQYKQPIGLSCFFTTTSPGLLAVPRGTERPGVGRGLYGRPGGGARWGVGVRCGELMGGGVMGSGGATGASNLLQCRRGPEAN